MKQLVDGIKDIKRWLEGLMTPMPRLMPAPIPVQNTPRTLPRTNRRQV